MKLLKYKILTLVLMLACSMSLLAAERRYDLKIEKITANFTGVDVEHALGISQIFPIPKEASIPAPTLRFRLGDNAVITVHNDTNEPATLHWHGLLVPYKQDGPQFSNTKIITPKSKHVFRFPIRQTGTYWYHSHTELQEQRGLYGAIVIEEDQPIEEVDHDIVYVMSDWTNELPKAVLYNLKKDGDYYSMKKNSIPTLRDAIKGGELGSYLKSEWTRMGAMDLSDVGYDAFLINGKIESKLKNVRHGEKIRFRIINASASTYFYFNIGKNRKFKVITKDGMPIQPVEVSELQVAIAETYDIIFKVPHMMKTFEAKATAQDITGSASLMFGMGEMEMATMKTKPSPYSMDHGNMDHESMDHRDMRGDEDGNDQGGDHDGEMNHMMDDGHHSTHGDKDGNDSGDYDEEMNQMLDDVDNKYGGHDHSMHGDKDGNDQGGSYDEELNQMLDDVANKYGGPDMPIPPIGKPKKLTYEMLKSVEPSKIDENLIRAKVIDLELSGDMERYTWHINGKPFSEDKYIEIKENEVITFRYINTTMMHHPMHLHGHFFRVLNGQGDYAPLMHTVDVAPMKTVTIEFHANEPGIWFLHCHNLYHMKMGMARLVKYEGFEQDEELKADQAKWGPTMTQDNSAFYRAELGLYSNTAELDINVNAGRFEVEMELEVDEYDIDSSEAEVIFKRYLDKFLAIGTGVVAENQKIYAALTVMYNLPGNIEMEGYVRHDGKAVVKLNKSIPLTTIRGGVLILDLEPEFDYKDGFEWSFDSELSYKYTERMSFGINYKRDEEGRDSVGFGIKIRF